MEIINPVHREFIETTDDFELADRLGLRYCGLCSACGVLSLVMPEAPVTIFHHYAESAGCLELPVCDSCIGEGVLDLSQDKVDSMESCRSDLCSWYVEEARARKARLSPPLFYAYESYPSVYSSGVDLNNDVSTGETAPPGRHHLGLRIRGTARRLVGGWANPDSKQPWICGKIPNTQCGTHRYGSATVRFGRLQPRLKRAGWDIGLLVTVDSSQVQLLL